MGRKVTQADISQACDSRWPVERRGFNTPTPKEETLMSPVNSHPCARFVGTTVMTLAALSLTACQGGDEARGDSLSAAETGESGESGNDREA
jgi:hypothetical protein